MKILVNATNLRVGGGVQKAVEFIRATMAYDHPHEFHYAVSDVVARNLEGLAAIPESRRWIAGVSPARPLAGRRTIRTLREIEDRIRPDAVYSVFGPTYVRFESPHLMGFAIAWITHPNPHAWACLRSPLTKAWYRAWILRTVRAARVADRWVLETAVGADGLARTLEVPRDRCDVIPNACAEHYYRASSAGIAPDPRIAGPRGSSFALLALSAWYPHKRLELIPAVAEQLRRLHSGRRFLFFLTLKEDSQPWAAIRRDAQARGVADDVINLGPVPVGDGPGLYQAADALFLPTVLESFTATYPEAMCMRRPIVTTDLPFAREICGDAALFFPPDDAAGAAAVIAGLAADDARRRELVERGSRRLGGLPDSRETFDMFVRLIETTARTR